ncbi:LOW QUALITY PROTEIN: uncharacterized protein LOC134346437 [Mobula hypostoma]|uniref:LOW QUALITY PROTEIN: uncharacterized protein LOC134346437 n=1 Tax=Mobula hypostoma TaxID=723540 RepID=UPI002FC3DFF7
MASKGQVESLTEEAICSICLDFFTDPVSLDCGHNFCRSCIRRCWKREERNSWPECREEFIDRTLRVNQALARLAEKTRKVNPNPREKKNKLHCEEHQEELKLFCETDEKLICVICRDAREHKYHNFMPVKEAVEIYKEQSHSLPSHITSQFGELHRILTEREQHLLRDLGEEKERILIPMEKNLQWIQENLNSIQKKLSKLQEQMAQKDSVVFLKEEACWKKRNIEEKQLLSVADGTLPVEKFDQPLLHTGWRDMFHVTKLNGYLGESALLGMRRTQNKRRGNGILNARLSSYRVKKPKRNCFWLSRRRRARLVDNRGTAGVQQLPETERTLNQEVPGMASKGQVESWTDEAICPICLDFFTDPVSLECGHNFCRSCITRHWKREERNICPECRAQFADRILRPCWLLARLTEKARKVQLKSRQKKRKLHCKKHEEELKLFCETDKKLICVICRDAREHKEHRFLPIKEAFEVYKDQVKSSFELLTKRKSVIKAMAELQEQNIERVREQSHSVQSEITSQFAELHQILTEKEQHLLRDLRKGEARIRNPMEKNLRVIQEKLNSIREEISMLQKQLDEKDSVKFLKEEAQQKKRICDEEVSLSVTDGALPIAKFNCLFLLKNILEESFDAINRVSVTLDVETANPELKVSEDRKSVRRTGTRRNLPDTGKRFTYWFCVLGSEGFTSGRHYWEVEVTENRYWGLGVAAESVERKRQVRLIPETGFWTIRRDDLVMRVLTSPESRLPAGPIPGRVGVYLSYESGTVSFYNAETKFHLYTFTGNKFTGKLYPFFWTGYTNQWLRICSGSAPETLRIQQQPRAAGPELPGSPDPEVHRHKRKLTGTSGGGADCKAEVRVNLASAENNTGGPSGSTKSETEFAFHIDDIFQNSWYCIESLPFPAAAVLSEQPPYLSTGRIGVRKHWVHSASARLVDNRGTAGRAAPKSEMNLDPEVTGVNMASKGQFESLTEEVICPICLDFFTDPLSLECGHSFCRSCITRCWEREERNSCPECREEFADRTLRVNRALANLSEKARKLNLNPKGKESKLHCEKHEENLKLFCETDKTLICLICRDAREHKSHNFMPINEAVEIYKDQVKSSLDSLTKRKSDFEEMEQQQKEKISEVREQSCSLQSHIASQFAELRQILIEKEQCLLRDLREEEARILHPMEKNLREIQENLNSIQEEISKLQERMNQQDSVIFLMEEARRKRRISDDTQTLSVTDGALLVEKFNHPYFFNIALEEPFDSIKRVSVTLDVETANPWLEVSEDRKSMRCSETRRDLPDTGKRFTYWLCVLGSEGFTSGRHYWEVQVAGNQGWCLGVAAESVDRKGAVRASLQTGFWIIERDDHGNNAFTSPESCLTVGPIPGRVGVYLSYESGTVSFYNAETKSHLHTFTGNKFTEKLYPFFWTWDENQWLRICSVPLRVCKRVGSGTDVRSKSV